MSKSLAIIVSLLFLHSCSSDALEQTIMKFRFSKNLDKDYVEKLVDQEYLDQAFKLIQTTKQNTITKGSKSDWSIAVANSYSEADSIKFAFLIDFYKNKSFENGSLMEIEYLKKPSFNDMLAIYLNSSVSLNESTIHSFSLENIPKRGSNKVIEYELKSLYSTHTLLNHYYNHVFSRSKKVSPPPNINFNNLSLSKEESAILFYHFISTYGIEICRENKKINNKDCSKILVEAQQIPTFEKQHFSKWKVPKLSNFKNDGIKNRPPTNYLDFHYHDIYKEIVLSYNACKK